jgi:nucleotide-binding universal stress UspA family protein
MAQLRRPIGNVLAAVDLSSGAAQVLSRVVRLPITPGSTITLLNVRPPHAGLPAPEKAADAEVERRVLEAFKPMAELVPAGVRTFPAITHGTPFVEIIWRARDERAELIVVGRHGHRRFADALIGSTAERVFRKGDLPTLIVGAVAEAPYKRPMVAVDLSDTSRRALELALRMLDPATETVEVVHAWDARSAGDPAERDGSAVAAFLGRFEDAGVRWSVTAREGDPRTVILDEARRKHADLLVLGTHGHGAAMHLLVGSVAEAVVRGAPCDVLVARTPARAFKLP